MGELDEPVRRRLFVTGGTGVLGHRAVKKLVENGHRVTALSRSAAKDALLGELGATPVRADLFDPDSVRRAVAGHDTLINLATSIPPADKAFRRDAWTDNDRIRTEGSKNLAAAAAAEGISRFVQESITLPYVDRGDEWIDELAPLAPSWNTKSALQAETTALGLRSKGIATVVLRIGALYAADASHTRFSIKYAAEGNAPLFGAPTAYYSMIHADDAAGAVSAALGLAAGIYNVVDDEPLTRAELVRVMADAAGRSHLRRAPSWLGWLIGGGAARALMRSQRVSNRKLRGASDWSPQLESARSGWPKVVDEAQSWAGD